MRLEQAGIDKKERGKQTTESLNIDVVSAFEKPQDNETTTI